MNLLRWLTFTFLFASGCTLIPNRPPRSVLHDFGVASPPQTARPQLTTEAVEWLQDDRIRYRLLYADPTQVRYYTLDRWVAPPILLLAQQFERSLTATARIHVKLEEFEQVFDRPGHSRVVVAVIVTVNSQGAAASRSRSFRIVRSTETADAAGAIKAFAAAIQDSARAIDEWLSVMP